MFLRQTFRHWFSSSTRTARRSGGRARARSCSPVVEQLENRLVPAVNFIPGPLLTPTNQTDIPLGGSSRVFEEPWLSVNNRGDTGNLVITTHDQVFVSTDMFINNVTDTYPTGNGGDTWHDFDTRGRVFWTNLDDAIANGGTAGVSVVRIDPLTGNNIGNAVVVQDPPGVQTDDRQALAVDSFPNSPHRDNIYVVWTRFGIPAPSNGNEVFVAASANQGQTWTVTQIGDSNGPDNMPNNGDDEGFGQQVHIAVDDNGDVWAAYHAQPGFVAGQTSVPDATSGQIRLFRSVDGGLNWTPSGTLPFTAGQADMTFNRQEAGNTRLIAGTDFLTQGSIQPYVLPDPVRANQIYIVAADDTDNNGADGDDADLYISRSTNNGATWTRTLLPHGGGTSFQLFPTAVIDQFGTIVVSWYDNRRGLRNDGPDDIPGNGDDNFLLDWMGMYSVDGGLTWSNPFRISDTPFDPDETPIRNFQGGPTTRIGEYFGLDVFGGTAYVVFNGNTPGDATTSQQIFFDAFAINGSLVVTGDDNGSATDDAMTIRRMAADTDYIEILVNGQRQYVGLFEALQQIDVQGMAGNDTLTVDTTNGALNIANRIRFVGGNGTDTVVAVSATATSWTISGAGSGTLGTVLDFDTTENLTGAGQADAFQFTGAGSLSGAINGAAGHDTVDFSTVGASVQLLVEGLGATDGFDLATLAGRFNDATNIDRVIGRLAGTTDRLTSPNRSTTWQVRAGVDQSFLTDDATARNLIFANFEELFGGTSTDKLTVDFSAGNPLTAVGLTYNGGTGVDDLTTVGTAGADVFNLTKLRFKVNGNVINYAALENVNGQGGQGNDNFRSLTNSLAAGLENIRFNGEGGDDSFLVTPAVVTFLTVDGSVGTDALKVERQGAVYRTPLPPRGATSGVYRFTNRRDLTFLSIERLDIGVLQAQP